MLQVELQGPKLSVSAAGFGCGGLMRSPSRNERMAVLGSAVDRGITHFDIGRIYGFGQAEAELGKFLHTVERDAVTVVMIVADGEESQPARRYRGRTRRRRPLRQNWCPRRRSALLVALGRREHLRLGDVRQLPGAGHPRLALQHRQGVQRAGRRAAAGPDLAVKTLDEFDRRLDQLDRDMPFPAAAWVRADRQGSAASVTLPEGWLDDPDDCTVSRALKAPTLREAVARLAERARAESWTHEEFLVACLQPEVSARESHGSEGRIRAARFPSRKSLEEFDFDHARGRKRIGPRSSMTPSTSGHGRGSTPSLRYPGCGSSRSTVSFGPRVPCCGGCAAAPSWPTSSGSARRSRPGWCCPSYACAGSPTRSTHRAGGDRVARDRVGLTEAAEKRFAILGDCSTPAKPEQPAVGGSPLHGIGWRPATSSGGAANTIVGRAR
jgi:Aldo/keto reductase family/IstB-like ATP binding protein